MTTHRPTPSVTALALLLTAGLAGEAVHGGDTAPPGLTLFQPDILPTALSPDGRFATFWTYAPQLAGYRWSVDEGLVMLPQVGGSTGCTSAALAPTDDGSVYRAFYNASCPPGIWRWPPDGPPEIVPDTETPPFEDVITYTSGTSADGHTHVGYADVIASSDRRAWRWTAATGHVELQDLPGGAQDARALASSADGSVVVGTGTQEPGDGEDLGVRPVAWLNGSTTPTLLGVIDPTGGSFDQRAWLVSSDGSTIAGLSGDQRVFRWTAERGLEEIPGMDTASGMSADGRWIWGTSPELDALVMWSEETGIVELRTWLESRGFLLPNEWFDDGVGIGSLDLSDDRRILLGRAVFVDRNVSQPFMYVLPDTCPGDIDASGTVDFADLTVLLADWGQPGGDADLDGSGLVDLLDLVSLLAAWGPCA